MNKSQGLWSLLLGSDKYSTQRAKWFYERAESIFNFATKLILLLGSIFLIVTFAINPYAGVFQLVITAIIAIFLAIVIIFAKLLFMAVGALIRIGEVLENEQDRQASTYRSLPYAPAPPSFTSKSVSSAINVPENKLRDGITEANTSAALNQSDASAADTNKTEGSQTASERMEFEKKRSSALQAITSRGFFVESVGDYPNIKWTIKKDFKVRRQIASIDELVAFAESAE